MSISTLLHTVRALALGCFLTLLLASVARAALVDPTNIQYDCTGSTVCQGGAVTLVTTSLSPTFNIANTSGNTGVTAGDDATFYVIVLVPNEQTATFSISGSPTLSPSPAVLLGTFTSGNLFGGGLAADASGTANPNISAFESASEQASGVGTVTSFNIYAASVLLTNVSDKGGTYLTSGDITGTLPAGSILLAYLADCNGTSASAACGSLTSSTTVMINGTPLSESLTIGATTPEPTSLLLLGIGLFGLAYFARRRSNFAPEA